LEGGLGPTVADDNCVLYRDVPAIAHSLSLFFLVRLLVVVTLQSSLSRPSIPLSYNQSWSKRSSTTLKSGCVVVRFHLWSSFHSSSVVVPQSSLNLTPLLGSPYQTPSVPSSVTTRSRCVFARCAASYLPVLILPIFRATFVALPSSPDQRLVPPSSIPTSSHFIINLSAKAHPQFVAAESSHTHRRRASGPRWRDRQTCPHSRQTGGPVEVNVHRLPTAFGHG